MKDLHEKINEVSSKVNEITAQNKEILSYLQAQAISSPIKSKRKISQSPDRKLSKQPKAEDVSENDDVDMAESETNVPQRTINNVLTPYSTNKLQIGGLTISAMLTRAISEKWHIKTNIPLDVKVKKEKTDKGRISKVLDACISLMKEEEKLTWLSGRSPDPKSNEHTPWAKNLAAFAKELETRFMNDLTTKEIAVGIKNKGGPLISSINDRLVAVDKKSAPNSTSNTPSSSK